MLDSSIVWILGSIAIVGFVIWGLTRRRITTTTRTYAGTHEEVLRQVEAERTPAEREEDRLYQLVLDVEDLYTGIFDDNAAIAAIAEKLGSFGADRAKVLEILRSESRNSHFLELVEQAEKQLNNGATQPPITQL
jgi:hypothetical protein